MRAVPIRKYGSPSDLSIAQVDDLRDPAEGHLLVEVIASSINAADLHVLHGYPFVVRLAFGWSRPKILTLGADVVGRVRQVGAGVSDFSVGDEVVADLSNAGFGGFAELVSAPASAWVKKPKPVSVTDAAALPLAGLTALWALEVTARLRAGERVLVLGASGGVGSFAVQIAAILGAEVTAVASAHKRDRIASVSPGTLLSHEEFEVLLARGDLNSSFDVVVDCGAFHSPFRYARLLRSGGRFVHVGGSFGRLLQTAFVGPMVGLFTRRRYRVVVLSAQVAMLEKLLNWVAEKKLRPLISHVVPLEELPAALQKIESRSAFGKIVVEVAQSE